MTGLEDGASGSVKDHVRSDLFVASGSEVDFFECSTEVDASVRQVFRFWTEAAFWKRVMGRDEVDARIDLAIGGKYEWYFLPASETSGPIGSNGCQVLSYVPDRMVSFTWNAPPTQPQSRELRTWVVIEIEPEDERSRCRLTHLGFGEAEHWRETRAYFEEAWPRVLAAMKAGLERD